VAVAVIVRGSSGFSWIGFTVAGQLPIFTGFPFSDVLDASPKSHIFEKNSILSYE